MHEVDPAITNAETRPELGYDHRDANWKTVWKTYYWFCAFGTFFVALSVGISWGLTGKKPGEEIRETYEIALPARENVPLLQSGEVAKLDVMEMKQGTKRRLESYGRNRQTGQMFIPIERAMDLTAERGVTPPQQPK